jgi:cytochrome c556
VGGSSPFASKSAEAKAQWSQVANRAPLMQYLESAWEPRLKPALSDKAQFTANADKIIREAELFAAIGEVLAKDGMADADAAEYKDFCNKLRDGAKEIIQGVKQKNFDQASKASSVIGKACAECHENYRS